MRILSDNSEEAPSGSAQGVAWKPPKHCAHEGASTEPCLVAKHRQGHTVDWCASSCHSCQSVKNIPVRAPLHPWGWPTNSWESTFGLLRAVSG